MSGERRYDIPQESFRKGPYKLRSGQIVRDITDNSSYHGARNGKGFQLETLNSDSKEELGTLLDLNKVKQLFREEYPDAYGSKVQTFPLAFLGQYGNFQADGPLPVLKPLIRVINQNVADKEVRHPPTAIIAGASQAYNVLSHRFRDGAKNHDAQKGEMTGCGGGTYGTSAVHSTKASKIRQTLTDDLPQNRFKKKIMDTTDGLRAMRFENVYQIVLDRMPEEYHDGRSDFHSRLKRPSED